jgi:hypothetical protein
LSFKLLAKGLLLTATISFLAFGRNISPGSGAATFQTLTVLGVLASIAFGAFVTIEVRSTKGPEETSSPPLPSAPVLAAKQTQIVN